MNIWLVTWIQEFSSSSGMQSYSSKSEKTGYVITWGDSLADVLKALETSIDSQSQILQIKTANFLGRSANVIAIHTENKS